jgi:hypothetical protein
MAFTGAADGAAARSLKAMAADISRTTSATTSMSRRAKPRRGSVAAGDALMDCMRYPEEMETPAGDTIVSAFSAALLMMARENDECVRKWPGFSDVVIAAFRGRADRAFRRPALHFPHLPFWRTIRRKGRITGQISL